MGTITIAYPGGLSAARAKAKADVDTAAGAARARYTTVVPGQDAVYTAKLDEAKRFSAAGYPWLQAAQYRLVAAEAWSAGVNLTQAADRIIAAANAWTDVSAEIERIRVKAKIDVDVAPTPRAVFAVSTTAVSQLEGI